MFSHRRYLIARSYFGHPLYKTTLSSSRLNFVNISLKTQACSAHNQKCIIINFHLPNLDMPPCSWAYWECACLGKESVFKSRDHWAFLFDRTFHRRSHRSQTLLCSEIAKTDALRIFRKISVVLIGFDVNMLADTINGLQCVSIFFYTKFAMMRPLVYITSQNCQ